MRITGHVRTRADHGTVVCLDPQIVTKPYGKLFMESLPDCRRAEVPQPIATVSQSVQIRTGRGLSE